MTKTERRKLINRRNVIRSDYQYALRQYNISYYDSGYIRADLRVEQDLDIARARLLIVDTVCSELGISILEGNDE